MAFSVIGRCEETGEMGVAVCSAIPSVGSLCPFVSLNGAISTQSYVNPTLGENGIRLLDMGLNVDLALTALIQQDEMREIRQVIGIDRRGNSFAFTGKDCLQWCGHLVGENYVTAGTFMSGEETLRTVAKSFQSTKNQSLELGDRLVRALEAGQAIGGDRRGQQSAALLVASKQLGLQYNLRVDEHTQPIAELRRIFHVAKSVGKELAQKYPGVIIRPKY